MTFWTSAPASAPSARPPGSGTPCDRSISPPTPTRNAWSFGRRFRVACRRRAGHIPIDRIQVGNGSTEIFHLLARAFLTPSDGPPPGAFLFTPTYGEYAGACRLAGGQVLSCDARPETGFRWDLEDAAARIEASRPALVILCNPNNPTGVYLGRPEVELLAGSSERAGSLFVVDEAYLSFVENAWDSLAMLERDHLVLVRSMTKDYAQTGLRLGFALASRRVVNILRAFQPDWSVNSLALSAGIAALADAGYLTRARQAVFQAKDYLVRELAALGFAVLPSEANFLLVEVGDAADWRAKLLTKGIVVRDCASFGLPQYIRVGIRRLPDCQRLVESMRDLLAAVKGGS